MNKIYHGDALDILKTLSDESVDCCVTSPPYWGLRDYGVKGQLGLEKTPEQYVEKMVDIFNEVKRVLKKEGTLWLNLGDSYAGSGQRGNSDAKKHSHCKSINAFNVPTGLKPKDLVGIPWMVAFALRNEGWYLRQDIIWHKPNPMPESVKDRCTKSHEYIFLISKSKKYYFDTLYEEATGYDGRNDIDYKGGNKDVSIGKHKRWKTPDGWDTTKGEGGHGSFHKSGREKGKKGYERKYENTNYGGDGNGLHNHPGYSNIENPYVKNKRSVWNVATEPFSEAHFATYPQKLIVDCIKAGCPENGIVLDPFMGSGTTAIVARKLNRNFIGIEINEEYIKIADKRLYNELGIYL
jgi:DNA modification methylase